MPILVTCTCGRQLRATDAQAGRRCKCPACGLILIVPVADPPTATPLPPTPNQPTPIQRPPLQPTPTHPTPVLPAYSATPILAQPVKPQPVTPAQPRTPAAPAGPTLAYAGLETPEPEPLVHGGDHPLPVIARAPEEVARLERGWRGNVWVVLLLMMFPLGWITFAGHTTAEQRMQRTVEKHPELQGDLEQIHNAQDFSTVNAGFEKLPGKRLDGAFLSRGSVWHLLMAIASAVLFAAIVRYALPTGVKTRQVALTALFTGTMGVVLLLGIQLFGSFCCIGAFYHAAMHPDAPLGPSLIGFILGIGVCEETIKAMPVLWKLRRRMLLSWRESAVIGMASGAGFGVSEGVLYATRYYNGMEGADVYFVRFLSCVALHVLLSGAAAVMIQRKQEHLMEDTDVFNWLITLMAVIIVPIVMHGLFNALAKHDLAAASLGVAIASFLFLAYLIRNGRWRERQVATAIAGGPKLVRTEKGTRFVAPPAPADGRRLTR
jgi:RsiW-degrading membrane proteinase PrsW (M82 family)